MKTIKKWEQLPKVILPPLLILLLLGCNKSQKVEKALDVNKIFLPKLNKAFDFSNTAELNDLIVDIANEKDDISIIDSKIKEYKDSQGIFQAISAKYSSSEGITNLVVPLAKNKNPEKYESAFFIVEECEMRCTSAWGCGECSQTIVERCKKQICSCSSGNGGCSSKITFPTSES